MWSHVINVKSHVIVPAVGHRCINNNNNLWPRMLLKKLLNQKPNILFEWPYNENKTCHTQLHTHTYAHTYTHTRIHTHTHTHTKLRKDQSNHLSTGSMTHNSVRAFLASTLLHRGGTG